MAKRRGKVSGNNSVMGYFRRIFSERPELLDTRSNAEITQLWLKDHPEHKELPASVRNSLANLKSLLRRKNRNTNPGPAGNNGTLSQRNLEILEAKIDDALTLARLIDGDELASVVRLLHRARNEIVWKLGQ